MNSRPTLQSKLQGQVSPAIAINARIDRPADLLRLITDPPAILYANPVTGMILIVTCTGCVLLKSFLETLRNAFSQLITLR